MELEEREQDTQEGTCGCVSFPPTDSSTVISSSGRGKGRGVCFGDRAPTLHPALPEPLALPLGTPRGLLDQKPRGSEKWHC